ncbi:hypothetical protein DQ04_09761010 [Trypanosoma grayi]|uniref:hypothetical protein n=1 Tax=Trypanosoma grayi TaxID=71804 RepID=UPI0004F41EED|nr:hypothetical protein DQ04_09761010 [Trypanosoma grayi]KEG07451.1 hypothetical protein DQ04_09761010 [Trypanosoma grayi]
MDLLAMPSPRPPIRLVRDTSDGRRRVVTAQGSSLPVSPTTLIRADCAGLRVRLERRSARVADELLLRRLAGIDGCVFKSRSPSCGVGDARLYASERGGCYDAVDGFFVDEWVRPAAGAASIPITTERQLCFDAEESASRVQKTSSRYAVLAFVSDVLASFEARNGVDSSLSDG